MTGPQTVTSGPVETVNYASTLSESDRRFRIIPGEVIGAAFGESGNRSPHSKWEMAEVES
jgi:hypothetical protein